MSYNRAICLIAIYSIRLYQLVFLSWRLPCCRFVPTCSEYAILVIRDYGLIRGGVKAVKRLLSCHPWGGFSLGYTPPSFKRKLK